MVRFEKSDKKIYLVDKNLAGNLMLVVENPLLHHLTQALS